MTPTVKLPHDLPVRAPHKGYQDELVAEYLADLVSSVNAAVRVSGGAAPYVPSFVTWLQLRSEKKRNHP